MKFLIFFIIIVFLNSCIKTPGINTNPSKQNPKIISSENTINEVEINIISLNELTDSQIKFYNQKKLKNLIIKLKNLKKFIIINIDIF